jgi:hypothetical protein
LGARIATGHAFKRTLPDHTDKKTLMAGSWLRFRWADGCGVDIALGNLTKLLIRLLLFIQRFLKQLRGLFLSQLGSPSLE